jgi:hypothetical protein
MPLINITLTFRMSYEKEFPACSHSPDRPGTGQPGARPWDIVGLRREWAFAAEPRSSPQPKSSPPGCPGAGFPEAGRIVKEKAWEANRSRMLLIPTLPLPPCLTGDLRLDRFRTPPGPSPHASSHFRSRPCDVALRNLLTCPEFSAMMP